MSEPYDGSELESKTNQFIYDQYQLHKERIDSSTPYAVAVAFGSQVAKWLHDTGRLNRESAHIPASTKVEILRESLEYIRSEAQSCTCPDDEECVALQDQWKCFWCLADEALDATKGFSLIAEPVTEKTAPAAPLAGITVECDRGYKTGWDNQRKYIAQLKDRIAALEVKLSKLLWHVTGGLLSKPDYELQTMVEAFEQHRDTYSDRKFHRRERDNDSADENELSHLDHSNRIQELRTENQKFRSALLQIAHDTSDNRDFFLQHTAQDALEPK